MRRWSYLAFALSVAIFIAINVVRNDNLKPADILAMGDSIIWWNGPDGQSLADVASAELQLSVTNIAVPSAPFIALQDSIAQQYKRGPWEWGILDGGANDLVDNCQTQQESVVMDRLIGDDLHSGAMPAFIQPVRADGPSIVIMGYYFPPAVGGRYTPCEAALAEINDRLKRYADRTDGVFFAPAADVIASDNLQHYDPDLLHPYPSVEGSRLIGMLVVADVIGAARGL